jgi:glutathione peroxidase-family protein
MPGARTFRLSRPASLGATRSQRDDDGQAGDVEWNFEKFLIAPGGEIVKRIRPRTRLSGPEFILLIEPHLPAGARAA